MLKFYFIKPKTEIRKFCHGYAITPRTVELGKVGYRNFSSLDLPCQRCAKNAYYIPGHPMESELWFDSKFSYAFKRAKV